MGRNIDRRTTARHLLMVHDSPSPYVLAVEMMEARWCSVICVKTGFILAVDSMETTKEKGKKWYCNNYIAYIHLMSDLDVQYSYTSVFKTFQ